MEEIKSKQKMKQNEIEQRTDQRTEQKTEQKTQVLNPELPQKENGETHIETEKCIYMIDNELGKGSFGAVFRVKRNIDKKYFAMKCECASVKKRVLAHEARVLLALNMLKSPHFAEMVDSGQVGERFSFLVLKLLGPDLWIIRLKQEGKRFTLNTALKIAEQSLEGIRDLHMVGFLHRDIKPPNFSIGLAEDNTQHVIYVFDFGLSRKICKKGVDLRTPRKACQFRGTARYAAMAAHDNIEQARKDDVEAWWYMIAEMIVVELPWKTFKGSDRDSIKTAKVKLREDPNGLKDLFKGVCTEQMSAVLCYIDKLDYNSIPDYDFIYHKIKEATVVQKLPYSKPVDWDPTNEYKGPKYKRSETYIVKELE